MITSSNAIAKKIVDNYKNYTDQDKGLYCFTEVGWLNTMVMNGGYLRVALGDAGVKRDDQGSISKRLAQYDNSKHLPSDRVLIKTYTDLVGIKRDYDIQDDLDKVASRIVEDGKKKELWNFKVPKDLVKDYIDSRLDPTKVCDYVRKLVDKVVAGKNPINIIEPLKLRKIQKRIIKKLLKMIAKHGIDCNLVTELAPRLGKTILFLALYNAINKMYGHKVMVIFGYGVGLSIFRSYQDEIKKYREFDMEYIDTRYNNAEQKFAQAVDNGKPAVVMVSLNTHEDQLPQYLIDYKQDVFALLEEGDFGAHTEKQIPKIQKMLDGKKSIRINASGTNIGRLAKAFGGDGIDDCIEVPYTVVEQDISIVDRVKRKYYNMSFDDSVNKHLEPVDEELRPSFTKIWKKPLAQTRWIEEVFSGIFGYKPELGLSIEQIAGEPLFGTMVFANIDKTPMEQLKTILSPVLTDHHIVILNGDTTTTRDAQDLVEKEIAAIKRGDYAGKTKLIVITNMIGSRSFTVPEIIAPLMMQDAGDVAPWGQKASRGLSPEQGSDFDKGIGKNYSHIFDFNMDPNKVRNTTQSLIYDARALSQFTGQTFSDCLTTVLDSVSLRDVMAGKWIKADEILEEMEDSNKLLQVANMTKKIDVSRLTQLQLGLLLGINGVLNKKEKKKEGLTTGKTYKKKVSGLPKKEHDKLVKNIMKAMKTLHESSTTVMNFFENPPSSYTECIDNISKDIQLNQQFFEIIGVSADAVVNHLFDLLPLEILDLSYKNSINGKSTDLIENSSIGIIKDNPLLWRPIVEELDINEKSKIMIVAGGRATEIDELVSKYGIDITKKIVYNDKYDFFCNIAKKKYNDIEIMKGDFTSMEFSKTIDDNLDELIVTGNPPYNAGDNGRTPIYQRFLKKLVDIKPKKVIFIIPPNWFSQPKEKLGQEVRDYLKILGVYKIQMNPVDMFDGATVNTCTVFCERDYKGDVELHSADGSSSVKLKNFYEHIIPEFDQTSASLIQRLKPGSPYTTYSGTKGNTNKYRIVCNYRCVKILSKHPIDELKVIEPNYKKQSGYRVFAEFDTEAEANENLDYYNSFWHSKLVQFILRRTKTSTLDNTQIQFVPRVSSFSKVFTDDELYKMFNLTTEEIQRVEDDHKRCH